MNWAISVYHRGMTSEQIKLEIEKLPMSEVDELQRWLAEQKVSAFDKTLETDAKAGRLNWL